MRINTIVAALFILPWTAANATVYTPLAWQSTVEHHANRVFVGQRKHISWIRDQNRNFIDDRLELAARSGRPVDVIVDLNRCLTPAEIERAFAPFGRISYVGRMISFVLLDQVAPSNLSKLAERPEVAMVQQRALMNPEMDIASRAVGAHKSSDYSGTAEDLGLTGNGVVIAFIGTGVTDSNFTALAGKLVAGFDATNPADPGDGSTNPPDTTTHESVMAAMAVGAGQTGQTCRNPGGTATPNCAGIAPGAKYVNVRQCHLVGTTDTCDSYAKAVDWVGMNAVKFSIRVVSMAFSSCGDDDGTSAEAQQANYLVAIGLVVVAASSQNPANCTPAGSIGDRIVRAPGSASDVLMVTASDDKGTVKRDNDTIWSNFTTGPRSDFSLMNIERTALKPDIAAPGQALEVFRTQANSHLTGVSGTSPATAITAGIAALVLEKYPLMTAESVKELLIDAADTSRNNQFNTATGKWDSSLGWGLVDVAAALSAAAAQGTDMTFPNCAATGSTSGQPCQLANGQPNWNNSDISTATAPRVGIANSISVLVTNRGQNAGLATVNFGVLIFGAGGPQFHHIGSQQVTLTPGQTMMLSQPWTPQSTDHTCAQISIAFGQDTDYTNNMTQRNLVISASTYQMQVNNPLFVPAHFAVETKSERRGWICRVDQPKFDLDPFKDCCRNVTITFLPPPNTPIGQQAQCQVGVFAAPFKGERRAIGGVTVVTYVPKPCPVEGQLVDVQGHPLALARLELNPAEEGHAGIDVVGNSDSNGFFKIVVTPDVPQTLRISAAGGESGRITLRPMCGPSLPRVVVGKQTVKLDYLPPIVIGEVPRGATAH